MIRNLKVLGLALGAVFAFSAMAASSASAIDTFTVEGGGSVAVSGLSHNNKFEITGPGTNVKCTTSTFSGTATNGASSLTITPTYTGKVEETPHGVPCTSSIGTATIDMNSCDYDLTGTTTGSDTGTDAIVSITCPANTEIVITNSTGLNLKIPAQTPTSGGVTYTNEAGKVNVKATSTGITYTCESAFLCNVAGIATEGNTADYTGNVVASGAKNISWSES
jgi:hypothetical protein